MHKKMSFKELLQQDVKDVFLNPQEFGETHTVNDKEMVVVIDDNELIGRQGQHMDGIYKGQKLVYVSAADFGPLPKQGSIFRLDGDTYTVDSAATEGDVYSITVSANRGQGRR